MRTELWLSVLHKNQGQGIAASKEYGLYVDQVCLHSPGAQEERRRGNNLHICLFQPPILWVSWSTRRPQAARHCCVLQELEQQVDFDIQKDLSRTFPNAARCDAIKSCHISSCS